MNGPYGLPDGRWSKWAAEAPAWNIFLESTTDALAGDLAGWAGDMPKGRLAAAPKRALLDWVSAREAELKAAATPDAWLMKLELSLSLSSAGLTIAGVALAGPVGALFAIPSIMVAIDKWRGADEVKRQAKRYADIAMTLQQLRNEISTR